MKDAYLPMEMRLLFVGESPPASGRFFYHADSGLYRAMREAFRIADPSIRDETFLDVFRNSGCWLTDLCPEPVDRLDPVSRRREWRKHEDLLSATIARLRPARIACLVRSIEANVDRAVSAAQWKGPVIRLPYPGRWSAHRIAFTELVTPLIRELLLPERSH